MEREIGPFMSERRDMKGPGPGRKNKNRFKSGIAGKESEDANMQGMPIGEDDFRELRERDMFAENNDRENVFYASDLSENFENMIQKVLEVEKSDLILKFKNLDL